MSANVLLTPNRRAAIALLRELDRLKRYQCDHHPTLTQSIEIQEAMVLHPQPPRPSHCLPQENQPSSPYSCLWLIQTQTSIKPERHQQTLPNRANSGKCLFIRACIDAVP